MKFFLVETFWPEKKGFVLHRNNIGEQYIFIHFLTPVTARLRGEDRYKTGGMRFFRSEYNAAFFISRL